MVSDEEFEKQAQARGYAVKRQLNRPDLLIVYTKNNNVKVEISKNKYHYIAGYGTNPADRQLIKDQLDELGLLLEKRRGRSLVYVEYNGMEGFWQLVELIENIDAIKTKILGRSTKVYAGEIADRDIFLKIAKTYAFALENEHQRLLDTSRTLLEADTIDHLITKGRSHRCSDDNLRREHIVPCVMIHNEAIRMLQRDKTISEVAQMVESNLGIVLLDAAEAQHIDLTLGLRTKMPSGWQFGDDPYARLHAGGITFDKTDEI